jgi:hypothetical protein
MTPVLAVSLDPLSGAAELVSRLVVRLVDSGRDDLFRLVDRYLFSTVDTAHGGGPFTANPSLRPLNTGLAAAGDVLLTVVLLVSSLRSMFERTVRATHTLKAVLPRILLAVVLMHGSPLFMQMAIDLSNALAHVALGLGERDGAAAALPWAAPLSPATTVAIASGGDLFQGVFAVALLVAVCILAFAYVVRAAVLSVLLVTAPLAALCSTLPETQGYATTWTRLFTVGLFMQPLQLVVLRVAIATDFSAGAGVVATFYALATLWVMLKVPGAMNTAAHTETKARSVAHEMLHHAEKLIHPAAHRTTTHHST